jgi:hypothetical protein
LEGLNIQNPRAQLIPELIKLVTKPENIGDLHLKMMLKYPEQFAIRKEIVTMFLTSFYKLLWNKDEELSRRLELEVLNGDHRESAFVEVRSEHVKNKNYNKK